VDGAPAELFDDSVELLCQPRLPDPGRPDHRHEMRDTLAGHLLPDPAQHVELAETADQRARVRTLTGGALWL
jgi:hypothetical protein